MTLVPDQVRGKAMRFRWTAGSIAHTAQEYLFYPDGTVEWHAAHEFDSRVSTDTPLPAAIEHMERPPYAATQLAPDICLISHLSKSGYTLTVVLDFSAATLVGIASNESTWEPVMGTFEIIGLQ